MRKLKYVEPTTGVDVMVKDLPAIKKPGDLPRIKMVQSMHRMNRIY
jgi:hypothetical protein